MRLLSSIVTGIVAQIVISVGVAISQFWGEPEMSFCGRFGTVSLHIIVWTCCVSLAIWTGVFICVVKFSRPYRRVESVRVAVAAGACVFACLLVPVVIDYTRGRVMGDMVSFNPMGGDIMYFNDPPPFDSHGKCNRSMLPISFRLFEVFRIWHPPFFDGLDQGVGQRPPVQPLNRHRLQNTQTPI